MKIYFFIYFLLLFLSTSSKTLKECADELGKCDRRCVIEKKTSPKEFVPCFRVCSILLNCDQYKNK